MAEQVNDLGIPTRAQPLNYKALEPVRLGASQGSAEGSRHSEGNEVDRRTLIVGQGIALSGEVTSCDRLIVEGSIQATLQKCQHVIVAEAGLFNGHASTENADIRGRFEGELVVRKRLLIRKGGHVSGTITYGEIEIEAGGRISGTIEKVERDHGASTPLPLSA